MNNFGIKDFLFHIIHGSLLLVIIYFCYTKPITEFFVNNGIKLASDTSTFYLALFLLLAYIAGLFIDALCDWFESGTPIIKKKLQILPENPVFLFLKNGNKCGIQLAYHKEIMTNLCFEAKLPSEKFNEGNSNLLFQTAKNIVFRECSDYQRDQIDSYFRLYIFFRNFSFTLLISSILVIIVNFYYFFLLLFAGIFSLCFTYRFALYYVRIVLGATYRPSK